MKYILNNDLTKIILVDIEKEMKKSYLDYSMSVIVGRALPDVRDGLKPVHRRILYTLYENGLGPDKSYRKCADTVGSVLGRYHPHGDGSVYDALVRMAQNFSLRYPLVDGHGNFGSIDGDPAAAYRYTEARMSKISTELLSDIDKDTVNFISNYDDRLKEPSVLPSKFPNLLVNGSTGIAVGMATNIPPHNIVEVIEVINLLIDNRECELSDIMKYIKGPDFPTGGIIMGHSGIINAYSTGRGKIILRAKADIEQDPNGRYKIIVTEIPYMVNKSRLLENISDLVKDKRIEGISNLRDESDRDGLRVVIELKRDSNPQLILNQLYTYSSLQETIGVIMLALVNGQPKVMNLKEILVNYLDFQIEVTTRRIKFELKKAKERAHILEGLKIALDFIDEVIKILRASKSVNEGKIQLIERFGLDDIQATAIVQMRLGQLTGLERKKIEEELESLSERIRELELILSDEKLVLDIIKSEINQIKDRYKDERKTEIQEVTGEVLMEDLIPVEDCVFTLTHYGYIKRLSTDTYKLQKRGGRGVSGMKQREEDFVEELFTASTHDNILFISNRGKMYRLKGYEMPEGSRASKGTNIINLLPLEKDEKIKAMIKVSEYDPDSYLVMITKNGIIKRTELNAYKNVRKNGLIAINLQDNDELIGTIMTDGTSDLIIATRYGMCIRINETQARPLSRSAQGVKGIRLHNNDDYVVGMARVYEGSSVVTITNKGQGRRTLESGYKVQSRGGFGKINYKVNEEKGYVAGIKVVNETDDLILISNDGVIIRIRVSDITAMSRYASGVRVMKLAENTELVTFAISENVDEIGEIGEIDEDQTESDYEEVDEDQINEISITEETDD